jgi:gas vesicle protein
LTGAAIGAGLSILFAPKTGVELRSQIGQHVGDLADTVSRSCRRISVAAGQLAECGRAIVRSRDADHTAWS